MSYHNLLEIDFLTSFVELQKRFYILMFLNCLLALFNTLEKKLFKFEGKIGNKFVLTY